MTTSAPTQRPTRRPAHRPAHHPHRVAVIAVPPVTTFDLSIPEVVFGATRVGEDPAYEVTVCTPTPGVVPAAIGIDIVVRHGLEAVEDADTVIVTGTGARVSADARVLDALRAAAARGRRIASICTGAFVLAQAGLLDSRRATTFWSMSEEFTERFPAVDIVPGVLFVEDDGVLTSAGLSAGIDLCLHMVRGDYGPPSRTPPPAWWSRPPPGRAARPSSSRRRSRPTAARPWPRPVPGPWPA